MTFVNMKESQSNRLLQLSGGVKRKQCLEDGGGSQPLKTHSSRISSDVAIISVSSNYLIILCYNPMKDIINIELFYCYFCPCQMPMSKQLAFIKTILNWKFHTQSHSAEQLAVQQCATMLQRRSSKILPGQCNDHRSDALTYVRHLVSIGLDNAPSILDS